MMWFKEFKQAVKELAKGRYHAVRHSLTEYSDGGLKHNWRAYIDDTNWTAEHSTPEEALAEMEVLCKISEKEGGD